jgi:hypothetical protein
MRVDVKSNGVFADTRLAGYQDVRTGCGNALSEMNRLAHRL